MAICFGILSCFSFLSIDSYANEQLNCVSTEVYEIEEPMMKNDFDIIQLDDLEIGEEKVVYTDNVGRQLVVEVTDVKKSAASSILTESKTFTFSEKFLGIEKKYMQVVCVSRWIRGDKILSLEGTYTTYVSGVSCYWNESQKRATDTVHSLGLNVHYNGKYGYIVFGATLDVYRQNISLSCSEDFK